MVNKELLMIKIVVAGYTQKKVAEKLGMSKAWFNKKINNKKTYFNTKEIEQMCALLNIKSKNDLIKIFFSKEC